MKDAIWSLLYPHKCILCDCLLDDKTVDICRQCAVKEPVFPHAQSGAQEKLTLRFLDSYTAVWYYEENVRRSILRYKFRKGLYLLPSYVSRLSDRISRDYGQSFDVLSWVPVSRRRKWKRGYDQAELLCRGAARELGIPCVRTLRKIRHTPPQSSTERSRRAGNVLGAYRVCEPENFAGKRVLLIDDIITTGATADECAKTLRIAGASGVYLATMAAAQKK